MQRAESYAALAPLLSAQLRRGVVTNCFLSAEDYQRELPRGLYYEEREGCLLLLRQRPGHLILNFYLQPGGMFFLPDVKKPVVTELSCRAKDADAMLSLIHISEPTSQRESSYAVWGGIGGSALPNASAVCGARGPRPKPRRQWKRQTHPLTRCGRFFLHSLTR